MKKLTDFLIGWLITLPFLMVIGFALGFMYGWLKEVLR